MARYRRIKVEYITVVGVNNVLYSPPPLCIRAPEELMWICADVVPGVCVCVCGVL